MLNLNLDKHGVKFYKSVQRTTSKKRTIARELQTVPGFTHDWEDFEFTIENEKKKIVDLKTMQYEFAKMKYKENEN